MKNGSAGASTMLEIVSLVDVGAKTTIKNPSTNNLYVDATAVPAAKNREAVMSLRLTGLGSEPMSNIRVYDALKESLHK
ncbi:MAG: hypothetical protein LBU32_27765 [Clostridiales bacterium]|nr:hypothetical protein [Clostridiales bacterium]